MTNTSLPGGDRLDLLQTFVRIVESGSLSAAAARLGTTQPTVSRRLQALERALGLRLLQRSTHGMKLTGDGERCFVHARELLGNWEALQAELRGSHEEARGPLRVLVPHALGQHQLIAPLADYLARHPGVSVEWLLSDRRPDFIAEGLDCAIQVGRVDDPSVVALPLAEVPRIVVGAPTLVGVHDAVHSGDDAARMARLQALPWLALRTFYQREVLLTRVGDTARPGALRRFSIASRLSTDSLYALREAVLAGLGVAIVSAWMVADELAAGRLLHLAPGWQAAPLPVYLVYPQAQLQPARLRLFLAAMRERVPAIAGVTAGVAARHAPPGDGVRSP